MARERQGVMLAHPLTAAKLRGWGEGSKFFVQPKLNGERCVVEWFNGEPIMLSSTGLEFKFLEHIKSVLKMFPGKNWDGELYTHGKTREWIAGICNRTKNQHPEEDELEFWVFDYKDYDTPQAERIVQLGKQRFVSPLKLVPTYIIDQQEIVPWVNHFLNEGYEGLILRHPLGFYETRRSNSMLKHKPTEVDYYKILDVLEAVSQEGENKGMVGKFLVMSPGKDIFKVSAGKLTHAQRKEIWHNKEKHKGMWLKVKHEKIRTGANNLPVSCVALEILDESEFTYE